MSDQPRVFEMVMIRLQEAFDAFQVATMCTSDGFRLIHFTSPVKHSTWSRSLLKTLLRAA